MANVPEPRMLRTVDAVNDVRDAPSRPANPVIIDGRNQYEPSLVEGYGIAYYGIGRGRSVRAA